MKINIFFSLHISTKCVDMILPLLKQLIKIGSIVVTLLF